MGIKGGVPINNKNFIQVVSEEFGEGIAELLILNTENIIRLDENIVLFALTSEEDLRALRQDTKTTKKHKNNFKVFLKQFELPESPDYMVYSKNGLLIGEVVSLVALLYDDDGNILGYTFMLKNVGLKQSEYNIFNIKDNTSGVVIYLLGKNGMQDGYFICNNLDNDIIRDSCAEVLDDLELRTVSNWYILTYNKVEYIYSESVWADNELGREFLNIGRFVPRH